MAIGLVAVVREAPGGAAVRFRAHTDRVSRRLRSLAWSPKAVFVCAEMAAGLPGAWLLLYACGLVTVGAFSGLCRAGDGGELHGGGVGTLFLSPAWGNVLMGVGVWRIATSLRVADREAARWLGAGIDPHHRMTSTARGLLSVAGCSLLRTSWTGRSTGG
jgi:hypothetical protein